MKVSIRHREGKCFEASTAKSSFLINSEEISPIEYFAVGMLSCSGVDIVTMSTKQGFSLENFSMDCEIERNGDYPQKFNSAHLIYCFDTNAPDEIAQRWVMASIETYCSTINTIRNCVEMRYSVVANGTMIIDHKTILKTNQPIEAMGDLGGCCTA